MDKIDIVIIHTGYSKYLYYSIVQSKKTNPNSTIYIISDKKYDKLEEYSTFVDIRTLYSDDSELFEKSYVHLGKSNYYFEMFCIKRWFILKNFMKKYNLEKVFHIDSDIMLFSNITEVLNSLGNFDIALASNLALTMCVKNVNVLDDFCLYVLNSYINEDILNEIKKKYNSGRHLIGVAGSISDMDFSSEYFKKHIKYKVINLSNIYNNSIFDSGVLYGEPHFKMRKKLKYQMKYIYFKNDIPYCNYTENNISMELKLNSIHFIVWSKIYMERAFKNKELDFNPIFINIFREYKVLKGKLSKFNTRMRNIFFK